MANGRRFLKRAFVIEIRRAAGRAETVVADQGLDAGCRGASANHGVRIALGREVRVSSPVPRQTVRNSGPFGSAASPAPSRYAQDLFEGVMAWHGMVLAALLVQPDPQPAFLSEDILYLHREGGADAGERIHHQRDEGVIAQPGRRRGAGEREERQNRFGCTLECDQHSMLRFIR